jgi:hypothetical protein
VTKSQLVANQIAVLITYLPSLLLSNFVFPVENMSGILQLVTRIVPATYFIDILNGLYLRNLGQPLHEGFSVHIHQTDGTTTVKRYKEAEGVIILDSDVRLYFQDSKAVNNALRHLIALVGEIFFREEKADI